MKVFYVCSWGGCGSKLLCRYLNNFGKAVHIHDPNPPDILEYIGFKNNSWGWCPYDLPEYEYKNKNVCNRGLEWFNGIKVNDEHEYYVIFLYRNPVYSIKSRFWSPVHLKNIRSPTIAISNVCKEKQDLFNIEEFYRNYMKKRSNYKIYAIKYEELFDKIKELDQLFNINQNNEIKLEDKIETARNYKWDVDLNIVYKPLINSMKKNKFIEII